MPRDDDKPVCGYLVGEHRPALLNLKFNPKVSIDSRTDQAQVRELVGSAMGPLDQVEAAVNRAVAAAIAAERAAMEQRLLEAMPQIRAALLRALGLI